MAFRLCDSTRAGFSAPSTRVPMDQQSSDREFIQICLLSRGLERSTPIGKGVSQLSLPGLSVHHPPGRVLVPRESLQAWWPRKFDDGVGFSRCGTRNFPTRRRIFSGEAKRSQATRSLAYPYIMRATGKRHESPLLLVGPLLVGAVDRSAPRGTRTGQAPANELKSAPE